VLVVYPGPTDRLGEFLQTARSRTPGEPDAAFRVLLDRECAACERLGIRDDLAKPSTYVLDTRGGVVYAYVGETSTDRPSVKAVLAQLDRAD
jgi:peroxiredoxin